MNLKIKQSLEYRKVTKTVMSFQRSCDLVLFLLY